MAIFKVSIPKAGKSAFINVDSDLITDEVTYAAIFAEGLKACLNAKMTKVGPVTKLEKEGRLEELAKENAAALAIAEKNLAALQTGNFKFPGSKAKSTEPREVINEAHRLAKNVILDQLRAQGITVSHVPAKDITAAAKALCESRGGDDDLAFYKQAKANIEARKAVPADLIDLSALGVKPDAEKVAKAAASKAANTERVKGLSAAKAGKTQKVAGRQKPKADAATVLADASAKPHNAGHAVH
jgi:hypothetical protein